MKPIITAWPYEVVGMDITEFSKSKSGNRYTLVMVDVYTNYVNLFPIKTQTAENMA